MYGVTPDILVGLLRHLLTFIAGIIVAKGWISAEYATEIVGGTIAIIGALFSAFFHASSNGVIPVQSSTTNMEKVVTTNTTNTTSATPAIAPAV